MARLLSNGHGRDLVRGAFEQLAKASSELLLAAPYFTYPDPLVDAATRGASIRLLIGLNAATHPSALDAVRERPRTFVRYYTGRFHAKLYVFDEAALVGSANLTDAGFQSNREIVAWFSEPQDEEAVDQARAIFETLWAHARPLTPGTMGLFREAWLAARRKGPDPDSEIARAVTRHEPPSISVEAQSSKVTEVAAERLRRQIQEEYRPAFDEVNAVLSEEDLFRSDVSMLDPPFRVNRFLNWLRLTHVLEEAWKDAPLRSFSNRRDEIVRLGREWRDAADGRVDEGYAEGVEGVLAPFASPEVLASAIKDELTAGLLGIHAFAEQLRFTSGGRAALPDRFSVISDPSRKLKLFGKFCALELAGTVRPTECPPVNGRSAKALRYLGFKVSGE
ncbi:phospholipase D family protein [Falsiroseomonas sp. HW251]|uniref:phospholipase D family protein n=1 Tax=Falsiroseomonas sp. HW251 TaxID=3390998 RepID=UPI003D3190B4